VEGLEFSAVGHASRARELHGAVRAVVQRRGLAGRATAVDQVRGRLSGPAADYQDEDAEVGRRDRFPILGRQERQSRIIGFR